MRKREAEEVGGQSLPPDFLGNSESIEQEPEPMSGK